MAYEEIIYDVSEQIATITLNRPDRLNAWTPVMEGEVLDAMQAAEKDADVRVIILTGADRGFCAGADLEALAWMKDVDIEEMGQEELLKRIAPDPGRTEARPDFGTTHSYYPSIQKPIIAAINGACVGLGMVIPLYCDIRICSDKAKFGTAFASRGLIAEYGMAWMLPRLIGMAHALDLLYSARIFGADEAHRMGLVNRVVAADELMNETRAYATQLATMVSPRSLRVIKQQTYDGLFQTLRESVDMATHEMYGAFASDDFKEGVAHFLEKRAPNFTGK